MIRITVSRLNEHEHFYFKNPYTREKIVQVLTKRINFINVANPDSWKAIALNEAIRKIGRWYYEMGTTHLDTEYSVSQEHIFTED